MKINFKIGKWNVGFLFRFVALKECEEMQGYTNKCRGNNYITMLDYDFNNQEIVEDDIKFLQEKRNKGDFCLFRSNKGFHAVNLEKETWKDLKMILDDSNCDSAFKFFPYSIGEKMHTLRLSKKRGKSIRFVKIIKGFKNDKELSLAHYILLRKLFPTFPEMKGNFDNNKNVILAGYNR